MRTIKRLPLSSVLDKYFSYDKNTGFIFRKKVEHPVWNNRIGKRCELNQSKGYLVVSLANKRYLAHRVDWKLHYGKDPEGIVDHINGVRSDNRINNLQILSNSSNIFKSGTRTDNKTGYSGVFYNKQWRKWDASIHIKRIKKHLGRFNSLEDAIQARRRAELEQYGFYSKNPSE